MLKGATVFIMGDVSRLNIEIKNTFQHSDLNYVLSPLLYSILLMA